jgi:aspartyl-tRNA(Asn)/glutamyl-tRNA(Gln) amidotransferase subunit B
MRTKEDAADYRYFPDPDLPPLVIGRDWVERVKGEMAELPRVMAERFVRDYALPEYDATTLTQSKAMAAYFEAAAKACGQPKLASNWIMGEVSRRLNGDGVEISNSLVSSNQLGLLIRRISENIISNNAAKQVFDRLWSAHLLIFKLSKELQKNLLIDDLIDLTIDDLGLKQLNDNAALEVIIDEVLYSNTENVNQYKSGKEKAFNALIGQVMKASKGKANPAQVNELLLKKLK